jgi:nucleotide-binding universal stress UspA family protein
VPGNPPGSGAGLDERSVPMSSVNTIMVAVDLSRYSLPTAQYATELADQLGADLLFVNVINHRDGGTVEAVAPTFDSFGLEKVVSDGMEERMKKRDEMLKALVNAAHADPARTRTMVRFGVPHLQLLEVIDAESPDLLIMATKGRTDLADVVVGSCARSMCRKSPIPVLSIRGDRFFDQ